MGKIKIISNPYAKKNLFQTFNNLDGEWIDINVKNNPNSQLLNNDFIEGFFSFYAKRIVDVIIKEYWVSGSPIELYFEGTDDDYKELEDICSLKEYEDRVVLKHDAAYLKNANEVLPCIIEKFNELEPIIVNTSQFQEQVLADLGKFTDATNDIVPICVMGNYSSGKSTFINALIGHEILPSGDEPVTAKIYKITQCDDSVSPSIQFVLNNEKIMMNFYDHTYSIEGHIDDEYQEQIENIMSQNNQSNLSSMMNRLLQYINSLKTEITSDLIVITIPFLGDIWKEQDTKFIILDTPGSNSASNIDHSIVLNEALKGLTNGLSIYVSEYDQLDTMDGKQLFDKIKQMKEIDSRFTMIVVNKADENALPEEGYFTKEKEEDILEQGVPKNLYTQGIFFVSSIIGLGAKTDGKFIDKHPHRVFRKNRYIFEDSEDIDYMQLYKFNIMPIQLKNRMVKLTDQKDDQLLYINSGLYSVEKEIQLFANKYAAYNKCKQSIFYLDHIIDITSKEIHEEKEKRENSKLEFENQLNDEKKKLINKLESRRDQFQEESMTQYDTDMYIHVKEITPSFSKESIDHYIDQLNEQQKDELDFESTNKDVSHSIEKLKNTFKNNINKVIDQPTLDNLKNIGKDIVDNTADTFDNINKREDRKNEAYNNAVKILLERINAECTLKVAHMMEDIDKTSQSYWNDKSQLIKEELAHIVTNSDVLSDEKQKELSKIIMTYQNIEFDKMENEKFEREDFNFNIKIFDMVIFESDRLNVRKLVRKSNNLFDEKANKFKFAIESSHGRSFENWLDNLMSIIRNNIVSYSPVLSEKQNQIDKETKRIQELQNQQDKIQESIVYIRDLMNWH